MLLLRNLGHSARTVVFVWMVILLWFAGSGSFGKPKPEQDTAPVSYFQQIRPILQQKCHGCHQPAVKQGDLLLTSYGDFKAGGRKGPAFLSSKPEQSNVLLHLKGELKPQMPLGGDPLGAEQIELFRRWIAEGAQDDTPEAARETLTPGELPVYHAPPVITALAYSPDGEVLAVSGYREVLLHKADGSGLKARLPGMSDRIQSLVYSPDGKILAAVGGTPARFGEVQFWDAREGKLGHAARVGYDTLFGAAFSPRRAQALVWFDRQDSPGDRGGNGEGATQDRASRRLGLRKCLLSGRQEAGHRKSRSGRKAYRSFHRVVYREHKRPQRPVGLHCTASPEGYCADRWRRPSAVPVQDGSA